MTQLSCINDSINDSLSYLKASKLHEHRTFFIFYRKLGNTFFRLRNSLSIPILTRKPNKFPIQANFAKKQTSGRSCGWCESLVEQHQQCRRTTAPNSSKYSALLLSWFFSFWGKHGHSIDYGCQTHVITAASHDIPGLFPPSLNSVWAWPVRGFTQWNDTH